jgi:hypothetical protein
MRFIITMKIIELDYTIHNSIHVHSTGDIRYLRSSASLCIVLRFFARADFYTPHRKVHTFNWVMK